jgi:hypothetical protein
VIVRYFPGWVVTLSVIFAKETLVSALSSREKPF